MTTYWLYIGLNVTHYDNCASPKKATTLELTMQSSQQLYTNTVILGWESDRSANVAAYQQSQTTSIYHLGQASLSCSKKCTNEPGPRTVNAPTGRTILQRDPAIQHHKCRWHTCIAPKWRTCTPDEQTLLFPLPLSLNFIIVKKQAIQFKQTK